MENIVIFIIIIIISSIISKNKKKQASQQQPQVFKDQNKRMPTNETSPQLGELLRQLKGLNTNTAGSKTFSDMKNRAEQVKPAGDDEYSKKENYEEVHSYEEPEKETYSYETEDRSYDKEDKSYDVSGKTYDTAASSYDNVSGFVKNLDNNSAYMNSVRREQLPNVAPINKHHTKVSLLDSKIKLRSAIITSEILKRKYT
ncbi:MAG TPA: hypothetical protein PLK90_05925 [Clostridiales bacterium]|jgi:hypothetical protein|nr:hypothetical protein [Clostridiales bacterium]HQP69920.1 hypothetical protein [Clostridiales bacterium]